MLIIWKFFGWVFIDMQTLFGPGKMRRFTWQQAIMKPWYNYLFREWPMYYCLCSLFSVRSQDLFSCMMFSEFRFPRKKYQICYKSYYHIPTEKDLLYNSLMKIELEKVWLLDTAVRFGDSSYRRWPKNKKNENPYLSRLLLTFIWTI